jgi:uncharacterized protein YbjT (DUF2867 family)
LETILLDKRCERKFGMIVITTPTGDIGHRVLQHVLQGSEPVRVIARDPSRMPQEVRQRVEVIQGSHGEAATIEKALAGAEALFWLVPPEPLMALNSVDEAYVGFTKPAADCGDLRPWARLG